MTKPVPDRREQRELLASLLPPCLLAACLPAVYALIAYCGIESCEQVDPAIPIPWASHVAWGVACCLAVLPLVVAAWTRLLPRLLCAFVLAAAVYVAGQLWIHLLAGSEWRPDPSRIERVG